MVGRRKGVKIVFLSIEVFAFVTVRFISLYSTCL